jgi:hypothetical protein
MPKQTARVLNVKSVFSAVDALFATAAEKGDFLDKQGKFLRNRIQAETRSGRDLSRDGQSQPDLSPGYKRWRRRLERGESKSKIRPDSKFFRADFSNLTLSGQLLKSLEYFVQRRKRQFEIKVSGTRRDPDGRSKIRTNQALVADLAERGRTFLGVDRKGVERVRKAFVDELRRQIRKNKFT